MTQRYVAAVLTALVIITALVDVTGWSPLAYAGLPVGAVIYLKWGRA